MNLEFLTQRDRPLDQLVRQEQVRLHRQTVPASVASSAVLGLMLAVVQSPVIAQPVLLMWFASLVVALLLRVGLYWQHGIAPPELRQSAVWVRRYRIVSLVHGVAWALASYLLYPDANLAHQLLLVFVLAGICVSTLSGYAFDLRAALAFCIPVLGTLWVQLLSKGDESGAAMAATVALFIAYVLAISLRAHRSMRETVALRAAQADQVAALRRSHDQLKRAEQLAGQGSFLWEPEHDKLEWSDGHYRLWGLEPGSVVPSRAVFRQGLHPDDKERVIAAFGTAREKCMGIECRYRVIWPDGSEHHVLARNDVLTHVDGSLAAMMGTLQDVTERTLIEARLEEKQQLLAVTQFVVNSVNEMVSVTDLQGVYRFVNDAWCRNWGMSSEQVLGRSIREVIPSILTPERAAALEQCVSSKELRVVRAKVALASLGERAMETTMTPYLTRDAAVQGVVSVTRDITEQQDIHAALARSLENLRRTFNATTDGMIAYDATATDGALLFANDRFYEMWGISKEQAKTLAPHAVMQVVQRQYLNPDHQKRRVDEILRLDESHVDRVELRDGRIMERRSVPMKDTTGHSRVWTFRDITLQEQAMEALRASDGQQRALLDAFPGYVSVIDQDYVYTHVNARVARLLERPASAIVGHHVRDVLGEERYLQNRDEVKRIQDGGPAIAEREFPATAGHGRIFLQLTHVRGAKGGGRLQRYYTFGVDITDLKRAQEALRAAKEDAERADRSKSAFLASVSHELRTPLNAILGFSQLLRAEAQVSQSASDNAGEIERAGRHLLSLVDDLIDLGGVEAGHLELTMARVVVETVINESLSMVAPLAANQGIRIVFDGGDARNAVVQADAMRLRQVIINLLSNAIKYNRPDGSVRVSCNRERSLGDMGDARIRIAVTDTGIGIAPDQARRVFSAFDRLGAERGQIEGTGIGLAISRRLVSAMGGSIGYESRLQQGSTFWIDLAPVASARSLTRDPAARDPAAPSGTYAVQPLLLKRRVRVLVAEDYGPNQTVLRLQLLSLGCDVDVVSDGAAALTSWNRGDYQLILSDLDMPNMGGHELARAVRRQEASRGTRVPIVAISAAVLAGERARCIEAGMDDMLTKPIALEELAAMLRRWLGDAAGEPQEDRSQTLANADDTEPPVLDLNRLYRVLGRVSTGHARELLATFLVAARDGLREMAIVGQDPALLVREMHRQQSSARTVGALRYAAMAQALEQRAQADGSTALVPELHLLQAALQDLQHEAAALDTMEPTSLPAPLIGESAPDIDCHSVLVVDDDPVVLLQMQQMLAGIGVKEVLTARNGIDAIIRLADRTTPVDVVVCDLNMPEMDGVEMIRRFGQSGFSGGLILMSGADEQLLATVSNLAQLQGLRVLGWIHKPATPELMRGILEGSAAPPSNLKVAGRESVLSPQAILAGIRAGEFSIWFQPKVRADSLVATGVEALARWRQADGTVVSPDLFIVVAERAGIIGELSGVLLGTALREGARLHAAGFPLTISLNVSAAWLDDLNLPDLLLHAAQAEGLTPADIKLEVTETGVTKDIAIALDVLTRLRLKGFGLSIDDFGIGYSSFEQLGRIPFTEMKLDRSFVQRAGRDAAARAILESSLAMAGKLELTTVAEGVETQAELDLMRELGFDDVQGHLIARPMPCDELVDWLRQRRL